MNENYINLGTLSNHSCYSLASSPCWYSQKTQLTLQLTTEDQQLWLTIRLPYDISDGTLERNKKLKNIQKSGATDKN